MPRKRGLADLSGKMVSYLQCNWPLTFVIEICIFIPRDLHFKPTTAAVFETQADVFCCFASPCFARTLGAHHRKPPEYKVDQIESHALQARTMRIPYSDQPFIIDLGKKFAFKFTLLYLLLMVHRNPILPAIVVRGAHILRSGILKANRAFERLQLCLTRATCWSCGIA